MRPNANPSVFPRDWIEHARGDLAIARIPLPPDAEYEQLCFHAQQAAEKGIKAVLLSRKIAFPFTHNLRTLLDLIPDDLPLIPELESASDLTPML